MKKASERLQELINAGKHSTDALLASAMISIRIYEEDWNRNFGPEAMVKRDRWWATYNAALTGLLAHSGYEEGKYQAVVATCLANAAHGEIK